MDTDEYSSRRTPPGGEAAGHPTLVRRIVAVNLVLGLITSAVAAWGRFAA